MLTPEAKSRLSKTIRDLRRELLDDLRAGAESAYLLGVPLDKAKLGQGARIRRARLEAWLTEQVRSDRQKGESSEQATDRHFVEALTLAAATWLHRLVVIKLLERQQRGRPAVVTGGWNSPVYRDFRELAPALAGDESEGYTVLLGLLFEELALDLPGLFGEVELVSLLPPSAPMLRKLVDALNDPVLDSAWADDTTLGWIYQYWNDPARKALDDALEADRKRKVAPHEIASKTQMFTERYMVEWLLQNSLGRLWLTLCKKKGWTPLVESEGVLDALEVRRAEWRAKREAGEVELDALMPIHNSLEDRWKYWVPQPIAEAELTTVPDSIREVKILDPACGSGHFLVIAFDLLYELYQEEARHRGEPWDHRRAVESILENNLHGIDIDPRAVQIAAAALMLKAWMNCPEAHPERLNLVASHLKLGALADDDPALVELRTGLREEAGIAPHLTDRVLQALRGADHLGSLLKVEEELRQALAAHESGAQRGLFDNVEAGDREAARTTLLDRLETFLSRHTSGDDLGLRLRGEQMAAGLRFVRLLQEGTYDLVVGNPPYQGTSKMADAAYVRKHYPRGKADLYAAFLERGLQLAKKGGMSALLTMRNWMFISQFTKLREHLLKTHDLRLLGDVDRGAFEDIADERVAAAMSVFRRARPDDQTTSTAMQPTPLDDKTRDSGRTARKRAAVLLQVGRFDFHVTSRKAIPNSPLIYWWPEAIIEAFQKYPLIGRKSPARQGLATADNTRFLRRPWEVQGEPSQSCFNSEWLPYIKGSEGREWFEPLSDLVYWEDCGTQIRNFCRNGRLASRPQNIDFYLKQGVAFTGIGNRFGARYHRFKSIFGHMGASIFSETPLAIACSMNSRQSRYILGCLNPGLHFESGDVNRLPILPIESTDEIFAQIEKAFDEHEAHRETSVEFKKPGPSCWTWAQDWAQRSVDRADGEPLPPWQPEYEAEPAVDHVSYALGIALGRFHGDGSGIAHEAPATALPRGLLFLSAAHPSRDLESDACEPLRRAWETHGQTVDSKRDLHSWLRLQAFKTDHLKRYEQRPIYLPLSSEKRTFVTWVSIHRFDAQTLPALLADHLRPALNTLNGELEDLRGSNDRDPRRIDRLLAWRQELEDHIELVRQIAEQGPPAAKPGDPPREVDAPFHLHLDDGVMIHAAALWPLLEPQGWKKPRAWWSELCRAEGKKDYDWSHTAARYFPRRAAEKCKKDPSLAVAHGTFWRDHPAKAYAWELRLQDEIGPDFQIDETDSDALRAEFLESNPEEAAQIETDEIKRRERKRKKEEKEAAAEKAAKTVAGPLFDGAS